MVPGIIADSALIGGCYADCASNALVRLCADDQIWTSGAQDIEVRPKDIQAVRGPNSGRKSLRIAVWSNQRIMENLQVDADKIRNRGAQAERLLSDELLAESFNTLEEKYINSWIATDARDTDARERLFQAVHVVRKVRDHLRVVMQRGEIEAKRIAELQGRRKGILERMMP